MRGFIRCGLNCYGVDQSEVARRICPEAEIVQADNEKGLPYNDDKFDVIYSKSVVEHFYNPEKLKEVKSEYFYQLPIVWKNPWLKPVSKFIGLVTPWPMENSIKLLRFSKEVMLLASAVKPATETSNVQP